MPSCDYGAYPRYFQYDPFQKYGGKTAKELKAGESVAEAKNQNLRKSKTPDISIHEAATTDCSASVSYTSLTTKRNLNRKPVLL